jgi:tRNA dimethylallyltransferase
MEAPILIAGPTGVGKSEIALRLAELVGGEIVSVDSMQVYRGMDIGTAKPSAEERARVPHHLINVVDVTQTFDAAQFLKLANAAVTEIHARGRVPILCGGTGLYFKVFLEGVGEAPPADPALRAELAATPLPTLLAELAERDPVTFAKVDRRNPRRVIRAVEVIRLTGKPFSEQRAAWVAPASAAAGKPVCAFGISRPPNQLRERIDERVDRMFGLGLVGETEALLKRGLDRNPGALQALGYRQVAEHLRGERSLEETIELVKIRTRQFAKRQMTWFHGQMRLEWITLDHEKKLEEVAEELARKWRANFL